MNTPKTNTIDIYKVVHKALRCLLFRVSNDIATYDLTTGKNLAELKSDFDDLSGWLKDHGGHEDNFFHDLLRDSHPEVFARLEKDHDASHKEWHEVERQARDLFEKNVSATEWQSFYLNFNAFVIGYLAHLQHEETVARPLLQSLATHDEMMVRLKGMFGTFTPESMARSKKWMLLSCNESELREMRLI